MSVARRVELDLHEALHERIEMELGGDAPYAPETVEEWINKAIHMQLVTPERNNEFAPDIKVDIPADVYRCAKLRQEYTDSDGPIEEYIFEYMRPEYDFTVVDR